MKMISFIVFILTRAHAAMLVHADFPV